MLDCRDLCSVDVDGLEAREHADTYFAPAGRDTPEELLRKKSLIENAVVFKAAIDAMPSIVLVLNENRQIIGANQTMLSAFGVGIDGIVGRRPGEVFQCVHACTGPDGCGTGRQCSACGAVLAVLTSRRIDGKAANECRLCCGEGHNASAKDVRVTATQFRLNSDRFTVCAIEDISDQKRLQVLNRIFFHDVLNTAGGISGLAGSLVEDRQLRLEDRIIGRIAALTDQLIEEIQSQRDLTYAEAHELEVIPQVFETDLLLQDLESLYSNHLVASGRRITIEDGWEGRIRSDVRLLKRVLGNLLKNALEATVPGGEVTVRCRRAAGVVFFDVHNDGEMSEEVKLQIFQRSFSTKWESGHGIGTYSIKLLTEQYLGGNVSFVSTKEEGTRFTVEVPKQLVLEDEGKPVAAVSDAE